MDSARTPVAFDSVMDLSLRTTSSPPPKSGDGMVSIVRPVPRPPWSILWYQNLWSLANNTAGESSSLSSGGVVGNEENRNTNVGDCSSTPFPPPQSLQHTHRLYRLSMGAFSSGDRFYPASSSCHHHPYNEHDDMDQQQSQTRFKTNFECVMPNDIPDERESGDENDSETSDSIVVTTSISDENGIRSVPASQSDSNNATFLGPHNRQATVVLDVACCDGPVQFKRISNPNFAVTVEHNEVFTPADPPTTDTMTMYISASSKLQPSLSSSSTSSTTASTAHPPLSSSSGRQCLQPPAQRQSQSLDSGNQWTSTNSDRHASPSSSSYENNTSTQAPASTLRTYLCIYCNQSFKSLFCYQKHKKRHLNPVSVDITTTIPSNSTSLREPSGTGSSKRAGCGPTFPGGGGAAREERKQGGIGSNAAPGGSFGILPESTKAKTKDLNVQFFPCKKCGCKFPSYYFVHKHRKICH